VKTSTFGKGSYEIVESGGLAFDHAVIIVEALMTLRGNVAADL